MSRLFLSRNLEDGNGRAGGSALTQMLQPALSRPRCRVVLLCCLCLADTCLEESVRPKRLLDESPWLQVYQRTPAVLTPTAPQ
jgi:hypothetical protein